MTRKHVAALLLGVALLASAGTVAEARMRFGRQYYGGWSYYPQRSYYYSYYYYQPYVGADYNHHYSIYYPSKPRYVYYYNPVKRYYWGRLDLEAKGDKKYSLLKEDDRKGSLNEIDEKAFPEPAEMPAIPESKDGAKMEPIDPATLPKDKPKDK
jgi:hypothetical protein